MVWCCLCQLLFQSTVLFHTSASHCVSCVRQCFCTIYTAAVAPWMGFSCTCLMYGKWSWSTIFFCILLNNCEGIVLSREWNVFCCFLQCHRNSLESGTHGIGQVLDYQAVPVVTLGVTGNFLYCPWRVLSCQLFLFDDENELAFSVTIGPVMSFPSKFIAVDHLHSTT